MLPKRLRMLSVFAGGCLSGSVLIVVWRGDLESTGSSARRAEPQSEPAMRVALDEARHAADVEPSPDEESPRGAPSPLSAPKAAAQHGEAAASEEGRAVADVLGHLEAAYRQKLAEVSPSTEPAAPAEGSAPVQANTAGVIAPAPAAATVQPAGVALAAQAPTRAAPAREEPSVAPAAVAPVVVVQVTPAPAAPNPAPPTANPALATSPPLAAVTPVGVVPQNVHIGDVHNGNTYQVQQVIQYVPMYNPWAYGGYVPPATATSRGGASKRVPYPSTLTNPDNPWGYDFPSALWTVR